MEIKVKIADWQVESFGEERLKPDLELEVVLDGTLVVGQSGDNSTSRREVYDGELVDFFSVDWVPGQVLTQGIVDCGIPVRFTMFSTETPKLKNGQKVKVKTPLIAIIDADYPALYRSPISAVLLNLKKEDGNYISRLKLKKAGPLLRSRHPSDECVEFANRTWDKL